MFSYLLVWIQELVCFLLGLRGLTVEILRKKKPYVSWCCICTWKCQGELVDYLFYVLYYRSCCHLCSLDTSNWIYALANFSLVLYRWSIFEDTTQASLVGCRSVPKQSLNGWLDYISIPFPTLKVKSIFHVIISVKMLWFPDQFSHFLVSVKICWWWESPVIIQSLKSDLIIHSLKSDLEFLSRTKVFGDQFQ